MKIYTVTKQSKIDYDFSVETEKYGAFLDFDAAVKRMKKVVKELKAELKDNIKEYSDKETYIDEDNGLYTEYKDFENGYWACNYGFQENYESYQVCVDVFEVEDANKSKKSRKTKEIKSKYLITILKGTEEEENLYAYLTSLEVEKIEMDMDGRYGAGFDITTEDGQTIEIGIIDAIRNITEK